MKTERQLECGLVHEISVVATEDQTAHAVGNIGVHVVATIFMIGFIEECSGWLVYPYLDKSEVSVGTHVNVHHRAAIEPGKPLSVRAKLVEIDGAQLTFEASVSHAGTILMKGTHQRRIIQTVRIKPSGKHGVELKCMWPAWSSAQWWL